MALVEIRQLTKQFRKGDEVITPLQEVNLDIERAISSRSWEQAVAARARLLNAMAGIDRPTSGEIVINGTDITKLSRGSLADWRAANIGYIFQMHNLIPVLTAYENVELPLLLLPMSAAERQKRVEIALDAVNLRDRANHYPRQLSGGQEQRVGIARAIVANPTIIVGDEPTGDLDAETTEQILDLVQRLNSELGMTLLARHARSQGCCPRPASTSTGKGQADRKGTRSGARRRATFRNGGPNHVQVRSLRTQESLAAPQPDDADGQRLGRGTVRLLLRRLRAARTCLGSPKIRRHCARWSCFKRIAFVRPAASCPRTTPAQPPSCRA